MSAIGPGDYVECVDVSPQCAGDRKCALLTLGAVYLINDVGVVPEGYEDAGEPIVWLACLPRTQPKNGFDPNRFRPVYRPKQSIIQGLLTPVHEGVPA